MPPTSITEGMNRPPVFPGSLAFYGLGQVGVAIRGPSGVIFVDPYLTDSDGEGGRLDRVFPPPVQPREVTDADAVLITHQHVDHFDPATLIPLAQASPKAVFAGPYTCDFGRLGIERERLRPARAFEPFDVLGARVTPLPSAHTSLEGIERGHAYLGYLIEWNGVTVYHPGDTVIWEAASGEGLEKGLIGALSRWKIDVAFLPINGRDYFRTARGLVGNTDFREAAELAEALDVGMVIPTHYDLFAGNAADPGHFVSYLYHLNPNRRHKVLRPGEQFYFVKQDWPPDGGSHAS